MIDPVIVDSVTKIANAIMEKKGYLYRLNKADVEIILEAQAKLLKEWEEQEKTDKKFAYRCHKIVDGRKK